MSGDLVTFKYNEPESVRVPKLNKVAQEAHDADKLDLDGGNATTMFSGGVDCDGGGA